MGTRPVGHGHAGGTLGPLTEEDENGTVPESCQVARLLIALRWFFAKLRLIQFCELFGTGWIAQKTLRLRAIVFLAPITLLPELRRGLSAAQAAFSFRDAMFGTPPPTVILLRFDLRRIGRNAGDLVFGSAAATTQQDDHGR